MVLGKVLNDINVNNTVELIGKYFGVNVLAGSLISLPINRLDMAKLFHELDFKKGAEIGVFDGQYSKMLCDNIPGLKLYAIDPWEVYDDLPELKIDKPSVRVNYIDKIAESYEQAKNLLQDHSCKLIKKLSLDAVKDFTKNSLDFVYLDGNHSFDYIMQDIIEWSKIVRPGGIVSGHDYTTRGYKEIGCQVRTAVNTYTSIHKIEPLFITSERRSSNWFFVKP